MSCKSCTSYPHDPKAEVCYLGRSLIRPDLPACDAYVERDCSDNPAPLVDDNPVPSITIQHGDQVWCMLRNGIRALYQARYFTSTTAIFLLHTLEPDAREHLSTLELWDKERSLFERHGLGPAGPLGMRLVWRNVLDTLRQLYISGAIDMDALLVCLDPGCTGSPTVADLLDAWETLKLRKLESEDWIDRLRYEDEVDELPL